MRAFVVLLFLFNSVAAFGQAPKASQAELLERAKILVAHDLKDPESARFRSLGVYSTETGARAVCGEMNAKNSYGAYVGYKKFAAAGTVVMTETDSSWSIIYPALCKTPAEPDGSIPLAP
jgi:hypothetical protein